MIQRKRSGFTLAGLMIVVAIAAIFALTPSAFACSSCGDKSHHNGSNWNNDNSGDNRGNDYSGSNRNNDNSVIDNSGNRNNDNSTNKNNSGMIGNTITGNKTGVFGNKTGVFDNTVTIQDNLNDNQVGLVNQKGTNNQQGVVNQKGSGNTQIVGGAGGGDAQGQKQGQMQGQIQGQIQGQGQSQDNVSNNEGVSLEVNQNFEDKRDHITGPNILNPDAKLSRGKAFKTKTYGVELLSNIDELTKAQAKKLASGSSDITYESALVLENDFSTDKVKCLYLKPKPAGEFMGYLYMGSDGADVNAAAMIGAAAVEAMKAGATHIRLVSTDVGEISGGSSWNIGLGGGASIMANGDSTAIAPNGGLGYGKAKAFNELRPEMVFELTFDKAFASKYTLTKGALGYDAVDGPDGP